MKDASSNDWERSKSKGSPKKSAKDEEEKKSKKDPAKPKKVPSDYALFTKLCGEDVLKGKKVADISERSKLVSDAFKEITDKQKKVLEDYKKAYEVKLKKWTKEYEEKGYYIDDDGNWSDLKA